MLSRTKRMIQLVINLAKDVSLANQINIGDSGNIFITNSSFFDRWWELIHAKLLDECPKEATIHVRLNRHSNLNELMPIYERLANMGATVYIWTSFDISNIDHTNINVVRYPATENWSSERFLIADTPTSGRAIVMWDDTLEIGMSFNPKGVLITKHSAIHDLAIELNEIVSAYS
jgi:hypothetical protein